MSEKPLMIVIEEARAQLFDAFNSIVKETKLPSFLLEGVVNDLLSDIRRQKNIELMTMLDMKEEEEQRK